MSLPSKFTNDSELIIVPEIGVLLIQETTDGHAATLLDPITIAILVDAGKDILLSLGAKAIANIFGRTDSPNLELLLKKLILDIADIIREAVDAAAIRSATSILNGAAMLLAEYNRAPDTVPERLTQAMMQSAAAINELQVLLPSSASAYVFGVYTRLAAMQQIAINTGSDGEAENVRSFAAQSLPALVAANDSLVNRTQARVGSISLRIEYEYGEDPNHLRPGGQLPPPRYTVYVCYYLLDGGEKSFRSRVESEAWALARERQSIDRSNVDIEFKLRIGTLLTKTIENINDISHWKPV